MSLVSEEKVIPFLKDSLLSKSSNLPQNRIPKRKRISDIKKPSSIPNSSSSTSFHRNNRKRNSEPRPHPPDCLNKRYWDDVRAGRIPEPSWTANSPILSASQKSPKIQKSDSKNIVSSTLSSMSSENLQNMPPIHTFPPLQMPFPTPGGPPLGLTAMPPLLGQISPFPHGPMPFMPMPPAMPLLFDPMMFSGLANNGVTKMAMDNKGPLSHVFTSTPTQTPSSSKHRLNSTFFPSTSSASDDQIDVIADALLSEVAKRNQGNKQESKKSLPENLCIIPIPMPIILPIPLTSEFIMKNFSKTVCK